MAVALVHAPVRVAPALVRVEAGNLQEARPITTNPSAKNNIEVRKKWLKFMVILVSFVYLATTQFTVSSCTDVQNRR